LGKCSRSSSGWSGSDLRGVFLASTAISGGKQTRPCSSGQRWLEVALDAPGGAGTAWARENGTESGP
jgi:hypothetical protein